MLTSNFKHPHPIDTMKKKKQSKTKTTTIPWTTSFNWTTNARQMICIVLAWLVRYILSVKQWLKSLFANAQTNTHTYFDDMLKIWKYYVKWKTLNDEILNRCAGWFDAIAKRFYLHMLLFVTNLSTKNDFASSHSHWVNTLTQNDVMWWIRLIIMRWWTYVNCSIRVHTINGKNEIHILNCSDYWRVKLDFHLIQQNWSV